MPCLQDQYQLYPSSAPSMADFLFHPRDPALQALRYGRLPEMPIEYPDLILMANGWPSEWAAKLGLLTL